MSKEIWVEYSRARQWSATSSHRRRASATGRLHRASVSCHVRRARVRRVARGTSSSYAHRASASGRLYHADAYRVNLQLCTPRPGQQSGTSCQRLPCFSWLQPQLCTSCLRQ